LHDPPFHPVVDALAPILHTITDVEQVLLALPLAQPQQQQQTQQQQQQQFKEPCWDEAVASALERVATWRGALWELCHGPLHVPPPPLTHTDPTHGTQHPHQQQLPQAFDIEAVSWVWRHLDKALARLVRALPSLLDEDTALLYTQQLQQQQRNTGSEDSFATAGAADARLVLASRLAHARREGGNALGMHSAPCKPLLWRMGGRPLLPRAPEVCEHR